MAQKKQTSPQKTEAANERQAKALTRESGAPVADNTNVLTDGARGGMMLQDVWYLEKLAHFDREVIPERRMHAKGSGAFGTFTVTRDITQYTKAKLFAKIGKQTDVFMRFSLVAAERGGSDVDRDIRGFAMKFYTEEGNWDLVGNNTPVFFLRDPLRFPDLNHAIKRDPQTNLNNPQAKWDFWSSLPEALHQVTITMSDRGIPASYRHMHGFGSHTFSFFNEAGERCWVKFHLRTQQGIQNLSDQQAMEVIAQTRDSHQMDLFNEIDRGNCPKWTMYIQVMTEEQANTHPYNPFDITKVWFHGDYPLMEVGVLELNRNPENYFADVEQAAFDPSHVVPGVGFSPDKMLQGRLFSYGDAQRYRVGVNAHQIPVNAPKCPFHSYHRDGPMRVDGNYGGTVTYQPNSKNEWGQQLEHQEPPLHSGGDVYHYEPKDDVTDDCFDQPGRLYRLMREEQKQALVMNTNAAMCQNGISVSQKVRMRHAAHCYLADPDYGTRLAKCMQLNLNEVKRLAKIDYDGRMSATMGD
ncbi:MAG: catalase [Oscillospiraceae bacterium]|jgi:catalase|nr:catalase [Oscillospiraceae bacterium]